MIIKVEAIVREEKAEDVIAALCNTLRGAFAFILL